MQISHSYSLERNNIHSQALALIRSCDLSTRAFTIKKGTSKYGKTISTATFPARMKSLRHAPLFLFQPNSNTMHFLTPLTPLQFTNRGYDNRLFWFLTLVVAVCNFSRYISPKDVLQPWEISIYENKKGRNKEYLKQPSPIQTAVNFIFFAYATLWFSLVNFWRVKHGPRLRILRIKIPLSRWVFHAFNRESLNCHLKFFCWGLSLDNPENRPKIHPDNLPKMVIKVCLFVAKKEIIYPQQTQPITEFMDTFFSMWCIFKHNNSHLIYHKSSI